MQARANRLAVFFHTSRTIVTVGSLIVPALLSVQYSDGFIDNATIIYWTTWVVSLLVTMCNGLMSLFKLDKRYYLVHTTLELMISEGWQYVELTGKYSGFYTHGIPPSHENQFVYFCHAVEKIRMRQVEEEYYKLSELHASHGGATQSLRSNEALRGNGLGNAAANPQALHAIPETGLTSLIPPTPFQGELARLAPDILQAVQQQLSRTGVEDAAAGTGSSGVTAQENTQSQINRQTSSVSVQ
jgi:hypothetical protein